MTQESKSFILLLDEGFNKGAWHGPNLARSLRGLTVTELLFRPSSEVHNIWELALHCAYWKYEVRNRLLGKKGSPFPLEGSNFFRRDTGLTLVFWKKDLALLKRQHAALRATVLKLKPGSYAKPAKGSRHSVRRTVLGIAAHDIYHAGQIGLLKRMANQRPRS